MRAVRPAGRPKPHGVPKGRRPAATGGNRRQHSAARKARRALIRALAKLEAERP